MTMPQTKKKPEPAPQPVQATGTTSPGGEVLTLGEAAAYLRFTEAEVLRLVHEQHLPARRLANEWRFLKGAIQDWLRTGPAPMPSKEAQLAVAGAWKDDPTLEAMLEEIYRQRGRPITEDGSYKLFHGLSREGEEK
jgi:excisionase family DNA binding protein